MEEHKEVQFDKYCKKCKHNELDEHEYPCALCLEHPTNLHSHKPTMWEKKKK